MLMTPSILIPLVVIIAVLAVVDEGELKLDASNVVVHSNPSDGYQVFEWSDGTHRYYDMQGRQLRQRPAKGLYIENGKIQFNK